MLQFNIIKINKLLKTSRSLLILSQSIQFHCNPLITDITLQQGFYIFFGVEVLKQRTDKLIYMCLTMYRKGPRNLQPEPCLQVLTSERFMPKNAETQDIWSFLAIK